MRGYDTWRETLIHALAVLDDISDTHGIDRIGFGTFSPEGGHFFVIDVSYRRGNGVQHSTTLNRAFWADKLVEEWEKLAHPARPSTKAATPRPVPESENRG